jgi:hypothetical protein
VSDENCNFSWRSDQDAIVLPAQMAVAVHLNDDGAVVVRQEGYPYDDEDAVIVLQAVNAEAVAKAIMARAAESIADRRAQAQPEPAVLLVQRRHVAGDHGEREPSLPLARVAQ